MALHVSTSPKVFQFDAGATARWRYVIWIPSIDPRITGVTLRSRSASSQGGLVGATYETMINTPPRYELTVADNRWLEIEVSFSIASPPAYLDLRLAYWLVATFPSIQGPDEEFTVTRQGHTNVSEAETGVKRRDSLRDDQILTWNMKSQYMSDSDADALWNFYYDRQGAANAFLWTDPTSGTTYLVRFVDDNLTREVFEYLLNNVGIRFETVDEPAMSEVALV